ncbi:MAG: response regulator [Gammaproteobacteria bacterium]|nr:response regulator [Gammaproteobacteria bacterium]
MMPKPTILVADDNEQNLYLTRFLLERSGYTVCEANNGEQAVAAVQSNSLALVLMDIQMPGMGGLEATRRIQATTNAPTVVALTAKVMAGDREAILAAGFDGYIQKPIEPDRFVTQVEAYLKNKE